MRQPRLKLDSREGFGTYRAIPYLACGPCNTPQFRRGLRACLGIEWKSARVQSCRQLRKSIRPLLQQVHVGIVWNPSGKPVESFSTCCHTEFAFRFRFWRWWFHHHWVWRFRTSPGNCWMLRESLQPLRAIHMIRSTKLH